MDNICISHHLIDIQHSNGVSTGVSASGVRCCRGAAMHSAALARHGGERLAVSGQMRGGGHFVGEKNQKLVVDWVREGYSCISFFVLDVFCCWTHRQRQSIPPHQFTQPACVLVSRRSEAVPTIYRAEHGAQREATRLVRRHTVQVVSVGQVPKRRICIIGGEFVPRQNHGLSLFAACGWHPMSAVRFAR